MDPFSITVGAVALLETANKLSKALMDRYQAFSAAPKKMCEIANDVTMVAGLVEVFATSVEGAGTGIRFPDKFQRDARNLVDQCFDVLTEIDTIIPSGSKKPDYSIRLRYAFGNEKKIQKHQEKLKQVQHMFMFMTTMWMYQLPSLQRKPPQLAPSRPQADGPIGPRDPGLFASDVGEGPSTPSLSLGSWTGVMQQVPVTIGGSGGVNFEATLTLNPIQNLQPQGVLRSRTSERERKSKEVERKEKKTLENLRRSPYFSMSMFSQPRKVTVHSRSREGGVERSRIEVAGRERIVPVIVNNSLQEKRKEEYKDEYEKERARMEMEAKMEMEKERKSKEEDDDREFSRKILSEGEAKVEVEDLISQWFDEAPPPSSDYDAYYAGTKNAAGPNTRPSSSPSSGPRVVIVEREPPPAGSSSGRRPSLSPSSIPNRRPSQSPSNRPSQRPRSDDWYWWCDNCNKKFHNDERRYQCQDCKDFDFCPSCYGSVWHQHPESRFRARGEKERPRSTGSSRY